MSAVALRTGVIVEGGVLVEGIVRPIDTNLPVGTAVAVARRQGMKCWRGCR